MTNQEAVGSDEMLIEMYSKQEGSFSTARFDDSMERNNEANKGLKLGNGKSIISVTTTRTRRHSTCSYVTKCVINFQSSL